MPEWVTLSCPSCGGRLQITHDIERFACAHCGREHLVRRSGGTIALTPVVEELREVRRGVDRTASELAITRIKDEVRALDGEIVGCQVHIWDLQRKVNMNHWVVVCTGLIGLLAVLFCITAGTWVGVLVVMLISGGLCAAVILGTARMHREIREAREYIAEVAQKRWGKERELQSHLDIVRG